MLVQPGDGALDDPALFAQPGAVRALGRGDLRRDVTSAQLAVVDLGPVIPSVLGLSPSHASKRFARFLDRAPRDDLDLEPVTHTDRVGESHVDL